MATSVAQICNKALGRLGISKFIADLADDSAEAEVCEVFYQDALDACLAAFPWPFATLRTSLAVKANEPARDGWRNVFALPSDCLFPRKLWPAGLNVALFNAYPYLPGQVPPVSMNPRTPSANQRIPFVIEKSSTDDSQVLLCDLDTPVLFYTAAFADPTKLPAMFVDAFAWLLGSEIAMALSIKPEREKLARERYEMRIRAAWASALRSEQEDMAPDSEMITGRL